MRRLPEKRHPTHPGRIFLEDFLRPLGIDPREAAERLGIPHPHLSEILSGGRPVTPDTALRLGRFTRTEPEYWLNFQHSVDLWDAREGRGREDILEIQPLIRTRGDAVP